MARARFIRPEFFTDEKLAAVPFGARLLFAAIWCQCDLRGVFEYLPKMLRIQTFPHDEGMTSVQIQEWLALLVSHGFIVRFEADGKPWGHVVRWNRHQHISVSETKNGTKRPPPPPITVIEPSNNGYETVTEPINNASPSPSPTPTATPTPTPTYSNARARDPAHHQAPADLPSRLLATWGEITTLAQSSIIATTAYQAARRLHHAPTAAQYLAVYRCACDRGSTGLPADQWPDFRDDIQRERLARSSTAARPHLDPATAAQIAAEESADERITPA